MRCRLSRNMWGINEMYCCVGICGVYMRCINCCVGICGRLMRSKLCRYMRGINKKWAV